MHPATGNWRICSVGAHRKWKLTGRRIRDKLIEVISIATGIRYFLKSGPETAVEGEKTLVCLDIRISSWFLYNISVTILLTWAKRSAGISCWTTPCERDGSAIQIPFRLSCRPGCSYIQLAMYGTSVKCLDFFLSKLVWSYRTLHTWIEVKDMKEDWVDCVDLRSPRSDKNCSLSVHWILPRIAPKIQSIALPVGHRWLCWEFLDWIQSSSSWYGDQWLCVFPQVHTLTPTGCSTHSTWDKFVQDQGFLWLISALKHRLPKKINYSRCRFCLTPWPSCMIIIKRWMKVQNQNIHTNGTILL